MSSKLVFAFAIYAAHGAIEHAGIVSSVSERGARSIIGKRHFAGIGANVVVTEINNANDATAFFARFDRNAESFPICARKAEREFLSDYVALQANDSRFVPVTETVETEKQEEPASVAELQLIGANVGDYVTVEHKETETPRYGETVTGYGPALPTGHMVKYLNKWRRVYCAQFGNAGSLYIGKPGKWIATVHSINGRV